MEIKGVQELELVSLVVEYEVQRQLNLIKISEELRQNGIKQNDVREEFIDVTDVFKQTICKVIRKALEKNQQVLAVKLPKFKGFLKRELMPDFRLGTEISDRARFWGRVGGIFHTDELPGYGITTEEVEKLRKVVKAEEYDAIVLVADKPENTEDALRAVVERAREAIEGVPQETRTSNPDGTTHYMRPRPGAARMYPETDIPPIRVTEQYLKHVGSHLPEMLEHKLERLTKEYGLNPKLARQISDSERSELFEIIVKESQVSPTTVAVFLTETLKALKRDGVQLDRVSENRIREIFRSLSSGELTKEAIPDIFSWLSKHENRSVKEAISSIGLEVLSKEELGKIVDKVIRANKKLIEERGMNAFGVLMGIIMKEVRGRANAGSVSELIRKKLEQ